MPILRVAGGHLECCVAQSSVVLPELSKPEGSRGFLISAMAMEGESGWPCGTHMLFSRVNRVTTLFP